MWDTHASVHGLPPAQLKRLNTWRALAVFDAILPDHDTAYRDAMALRPKQKSRR